MITSDSLSKRLEALESQNEEFRRRLDRSKGLLIAILLTTGLGLSGSIWIGVGVGFKPSTRTEKIQTRGLVVVDGSGVKRAELGTVSGGDEIGLTLYDRSGLARITLGHHQIPGQPGESGLIFDGPSHPQITLQAGDEATGFLLISDKQGEGRIQVSGAGNTEGLTVWDRQGRTLARLPAGR